MAQSWAIERTMKIERSFTIAYLDHRKKLLWYNGSLLKDKVVSAGEYDVPTDWTVNGVWEKGATKADLNCTRGPDIKTVDASDVSVLEKSVEATREIMRGFEANYQLQFQQLRIEVKMAFSNPSWQSPDSEQATGFGLCKDADVFSHPDNPLNESQSHP
jgi:hypothetical protein